MSSHLKYVFMYGVKCGLYLVSYCMHAQPIQHNLLKRPSVRLILSICLALISTKRQTSMSTCEEFS